METEATRLVMQMSRIINTYHGLYNRSKRGSLGSIKYFVVHYTGSMACAKNNCIFFSGGNRKSSADLFVDRDGAIWEYNNILDGWYSWHCGDGGGRYGITNANSIGVEVVSDGCDFTDAQIASVAWLYQHYCNMLGRRLEVVRHYDASRKQCPAPYVNASRWAALKESVANGYEEDDDMKLTDTIKRPDGHEGTVETILGYADQRIEQLGRTDDPTGRGKDGVNLYDRILWMAAKQAEMEEKLDKVLELLMERAD